VIIAQNATSRSGSALCSDSAAMGPVSRWVSPSSTTRKALLRGRRGPPGRGTSADVGALGTEVEHPPHDRLLPGPAGEVEVQTGR